MEARWALAGAAAATVGAALRRSARLCSQVAAGEIGAGSAALVGPVPKMEAATSPPCYPPQATRRSVAAEAV